MPEEQLNVCDTVPEGLTAVTDSEGLIPKRLAYTALVLTAMPRIKLLICVANVCASD